jgi:hypothetical protein
MYCNRIRIISLLLLLVLALSACGSTSTSGTSDSNVPPPPDNNIPPPASNAELNYYCSVSQGFNFKKDEQMKVGHLNYLKIGDTVVESDFEVTDPEDITKTKKVVGVMSNIAWAGGYAQPIIVDAQVSNRNKITIYDLTLKSLSNTSVEFSFDTYDYDPAEKKYFKCFHTDGKILNALTLKSGGNLVLRIATDASGEIESPKNFSFTLGALPAEQSAAQQIYIATSVNNKTVRRWGVPML